MKKYESPAVELVDFQSDEVMTGDPNIDSSTMDKNDGWE